MTAGPGSLEFIDSTVSTHGADRRAAALVARIGFVVTSAAFMLLSAYIYRDVFGPVSVFKYMGIRVLNPPADVTFAFFALGLLPALFLPVHMRRPTDVVQLFLYYSVHVQTAAVMPLVSRSPFTVQLEFMLAITLALAALDVRYAVPLLAVPRVRVNAGLFWAFCAAYYVLALAVFARSGYLRFNNISLVDVYGQRMELAEHVDEIGHFFFYVANWTGAAFAPFLVIAGLYKKRWLLVLVGIIIATAAFVASSAKTNYMALGAVMGGYVLMSRTKGHHLAAVMGAGFIVMALGLLGLDTLIGTVTPTGEMVPSLTFLVFHRTFTNNGFLSAIYLDVFRETGFAYYADSFLRWLPGTRLPGVAAQIAGASFSDIPGVHANAHLWADGYANLGYAGVGFVSVLTAIVLWLYDSVTVHKVAYVVAAALIVHAAILANAGPHTAMISNGMFLTFILIYAWPDANATRVESSAAGFAQRRA